MWRVLLVLIPAAFGLAQDESGYTIGKVLGGQQYAASALWSRDNYLLVSDLPTGKITKVDGQGPSTYREDIHAAGLAFDSEGRLLICDPVQRYVIRIDKKGRTEVVADKFEGKHLNGPNSIAVSKNGHIWFTDPAFASADKQRELPFYGVYHIPPKGELTTVARLDTRPNGVANSADGHTLYVTDSDSRTVLAWDVDKSGNAANQRVFARVHNGVPNGVHAGADGRIYVAARPLLIFSPAGQQVANIELPETATDVTPADTDQSTVYVTARTSVYVIRTNAKPEKAK